MVVVAEGAADEDHTRGVVNVKVLSPGAGIKCRHEGKTLYGHVNVVREDATVVATLTRVERPVLVPADKVVVLRGRGVSSRGRVAGESANGLSVRVGARVTIPVPGRPVGTVVVIQNASRSLRPGYVEVELPEMADVGNVYDKLGRAVTELRYGGDRSARGSKEERERLCDAVDAMLGVKRFFHCRELEVHRLNEAETTH